MGVASYIAGRDFLPNLETKESIKFKKKKSSCKQEIGSMSKATGILLWHSAVSEYGKTKKGESETDTVSARPEFYCRACSNNQY